MNSGADLPIAGSFIYPYLTIIRTKPDIAVRGIKNQAQQVDAIVRVMVMQPDGEHCMREVLVCDPFVVALRTVPYMSQFSFSAFFGRSGSPSMVLLPSGVEVPILSFPYRMVAPCRPPTAAECLCPPASPSPTKVLPDDGTTTPAAGVASSAWASRKHGEEHAAPHVGLSAPGEGCDQ